MKKIECLIRPSKLDEVKEAVNLAGIRGMTVSQVVGCGMQKGRKEVYRGHEYNVNLLPKIKIEIAIQEEKVEEVINAIVEAARTGEVGDGKIFVYPLEEAVKIRTGERGRDAL
jgi:nitrogen regulatory protein P-II 1